MFNNQYRSSPEVNSYETDPPREEGILAVFFLPGLRGGEGLVSFQILGFLKR